ncbi:ABC transporter ATP-binding protein [Treponema sp. OMZ 840]|uniref:ABC transporter ATP-binding protein n=1 Tax=Treponema sp. OMZ 840 TaxID=244313 RepID=UPI003D935C81
MPRIELHNVSKKWGSFVAVNKLDMVIEDREFITLLGPSGCGKTTTLRMIAGLETPTEGKIVIGDTVVFDSERGINISPAKRDIGFLFQNYALWPHMTVYKNIAFGLENLKWSKDKIDERVTEVLKTLKIEEFSGRYPAELSGGQQQRVAIARTLAPKPQVLFMDEPLSNLDAKLRSEMRTELKRLHSDTNSTFVYVTHDQLEAMTLATRICLIEKGDLQQYDPPLTVYNNPANLFVADFIGNPTMNFIPATAKQTEKNKLCVDFFGINAEFTGEKELQLENESITLGIRPEFLPISDKGLIEGLAYSTLPSGMETIVKINLRGNILSSVVFGAIDYKVDQKIHFDIAGNNIIVFDNTSKKNIGLGSLKIT